MSTSRTGKPRASRDAARGWNMRISAAIVHRLPRDAEAGEVAASFGLDNCLRQTFYRDFELSICPGQIVAVVGPSGGGKSLLLREVLRRCGRARALGLAELARSSVPAIAAIRGGGRAKRLETLSRCGLADAQALITPAQNLSEGQLYRLALAGALHAAARRPGGTLVVADEFASNLDDLTARMLCLQVRKLLTGPLFEGAPRVALLLATAREGLLEFLRPDTVIFKPLGGLPTVQARPRDHAAMAGRPQDWAIRRGTMEDYRALSQFHYLSGPPAANKRVYVIRPPADGSVPAWASPAAVLVVSPPVRNVRGRNLATGGRYAGPDRGKGLRRLNRELECISRVIVHPVYRGCGLAVRLVRHALRTARTPMVEALAAMGALHPMFELAGMTAYRIAPDEHSARLLSAAQCVGLDGQDLWSVEPVRRRLARMDAGARFLQREIRRCIRLTISPKRRLRLKDPLAEVCRRSRRQYVYYLYRRCRGCVVCSHASNPHAFPHTTRKGMAPRMTPRTSPRAQPHA